MTSSSSQKSKDSDDLKDLDPEFALPVELASATWLKKLCRDFFRKGFTRGYAKGIFDAGASSVVNDSRIVRPAQLQLVQPIGGKRNG